MRIATATLALLAILTSSLALAATVTVNGTQVGTLQSLTVDAQGNTSIAVTGNAVPPPVEPPAPACPAGVVCLDKTLPIPQQSVSLGASQVMAVKMTVTSKGRFSTINTPASSPTRVVALSATPGDMNPANTRCKTSGDEVTSNLWQTTPADRKCVFPAGSVVYANIQMTNCTTSRCTFLIAAQEGL